MSEMKKLSVAVVHGIGITKPGYADSFVKGINKVFNEELSLYLKKKDDYSQHIEYSQIIWDDVLSENQSKLKKLLEKIFEQIKPKKRVGFLKKAGLFALVLVGGGWLFKANGIMMTLAGAAAYSAPKLIYRLRTSFAAEYIGDIIGYQNKEAYAKIYQKILKGMESLDKPQASAGLTFISHSLGTVITSDYIYDRQKAEGQAAANMPLVNLFTLGSPLALFSLRYGPEMFKSPVKLEDPHGRWINIFDRDDPIAYPLKALNEVYDKAVFRDQEVDAGLFGVAHVKYWNRPVVYSLIARKLILDWIRANDLMPEDQWENLRAKYEEHGGTKPLV